MKYNSKYEICDIFPVSLKLQGSYLRLNNYSFSSCKNNLWFKTANR